MIDVSIVIVNWNVKELITECINSIIETTKGISYEIIVSEVFIDSDYKIYKNAVILPGVHIGMHTTVGANSVIPKDIPDFCVAVGVTACIIKRYNTVSEKWERTNQDGTFIR